MYTKTEGYSKNNRSLISPKFLINEAVGLILVCGHGNSRSIYIESNNASNERLIAKYSITFPNGSFASDVVDGWKYTVLSNSKETADEIQSLKKQSHTAEEYQVDKASIQSFTTSMDIERGQRLILNGEQDNGIIAALKKIGETIEFPRDRGCTIF
jgi:hypothetical protein